MPGYSTKTLLCVFLLLFGLGALHAQQPTVTTWTGTLDARGTELRLEIDITVDGKKTAGTMRSLDQNNAKFELSDISLDGRLAFSVKKLGAKFEGKFEEEGTSAKGTYQRSGVQLPLTLKRGASRAGKELKDKQPEKLKEAWVGSLNMGIMKPLMQFRIIESAADKPKCYFDSITEGATGFAGTWVIKDGELKFEIPEIRLEYTGKISSTGETAEGIWKQAGREFPLSLKRQPTEYRSENTWKNRPQRPRGPYPYDREQVKFENSVDQLTLAGTLTLPKSPGKHPAVILISGSGPQDRDETIMEHKPFLVLADYLSRNGIAVLRYDDRGYGESTGKFGGATTADFANDASAAVEFLKSHERIDPQQIGLAGHSEGGLIAPMVCGLRSDVAFVVLMAGTGVDGATIITSQSEAMLRVEMNKPEQQSELELAIKLNRLLIGEASNGSLDFDNASFAMKLDALLEELTEEESKAVKARLRSEAKRLEDKWMKYFIHYDPTEALSNIECPVLAIIGSKDLQVLPELNMPGIESALKAGGNTDFELVTLEGLNHLFQECATGSMNEYISIQETWNPKAQERIKDWILEHVKLAD